MSAAAAYPILAGAALVLLAGCSDDAESVLVSASGGAGGTAGAVGGVKPPICPPGAAGAEQILIKTEAGASYCIDQREVRRGEYKAFLDAKGGDVSGQVPSCYWNERYAPLEDDPSDPHGAYGCPTDSWALETYPDYPVVCVDVCDALAYCAWAGKRLCGLVGVEATDRNKLPDHHGAADSQLSEWTYACTQGGKTQYPYGDTYEPGRCIDKPRIDSEGLEAQQATTDPGEPCHGTDWPFDQIFHMSGSVSEWMNLCDFAGSSCAAGGGFVGQPPERLACTPAGSLVRSSIYPGTGFRCCADTLPGP